MRELVCDYVEGIAPAAGEHVFPAENHGTVLPRLAAQHLVADMHDAGLVLVLARAHEKLAGVDNHRGEASIAIESEPEHEPARECADAQPHAVVEHETAGRLETLLVQEQQRERA